MKPNEPSPEQNAALKRYATANGRNWKDKLVTAWANGSDDLEADGPLLRQVRNGWGPRWLLRHGQAAIATRYWHAVCYLDGAPDPIQSFGTEEGARTFAGIEIGAGRADHAAIWFGRRVDGANQLATDARRIAVMP